MLRWMYEYTRIYKIRNEDIREKVDAALMDVKMREAMLIWFEYMRRKSLEEV